MLVLADPCRSSSCRGKWLVYLTIALLAFCLTLLPEELLRYERHAVFSEGWRWLTSHLVHLSLSHLAFNLAGLVLVCELFWQALPVRHGVALMLFAACVINLLLWLLHPDLEWYAGLSGIVHALWAACVTTSLLKGHAKGQRHSQFLATLGAALLLAKLIGERMDMPFFSVAAEEFPVIDAAHAYGALAGLVYALLWSQCIGLRDRR